MRCRDLLDRRLPGLDFQPQELLSGAPKAMILMAEDSETDPAIAANGGHVLWKDDERNATGTSFAKRLRYQRANERAAKVSVPLIRLDDDVAEPVVIMRPTHGLQLAVAQRVGSITHEKKRVSVAFLPLKDLGGGEWWLGAWRQPSKLQFGPYPSCNPRRVSWVKRCQS